MLDWFVSSGDRVAEAIPQVYDYWLVGLSYLIAAGASFTALRLAGRVAGAESARLRRTWLVIGATSMGCGVWSMHYIAILAMHWHVQVEFDAALTALSTVFAIVASGFAFHLVAKRHTSPIWQCIGGVVLGAGIGLMHYTGMAAMHMDAVIRFEPGLFALSVVVAVALSTLALRVLFGSLESKPGSSEMNSIASAAVMGLAVSAMHYTGMAATYFLPAAAPADHVRHAQDIDPTLLAVVVVAAVLAILAISFAAAVIDRRFHIERLKAQLKEASLDTVVENVGDGIVTIDEFGIIQTFNAAAERMFDYAQAEVIGQNVAILMPAEVRAEHDAYVRNADLHGPRILGRQRTLQGVRKDGTRFDLDLCVSMTRVGGERRFIGVCRDVTEQRERERRLQASEARLRSLAANVPGYLWQREHSADGSVKIAYISEGCTRILGYTPEELMAMPDGILGIAVGADAAEGFHRARSAAKEAVAFDHNLQVRTKSGEIKWLRAIGRPRPAEYGRIVYDGLTIDVTSLMEREQQLAASEAKLRALSANLPGYLWQREQRPDGTIRLHYLGEGVGRILGYEPDELLAMPGGYYGQVHPEDLERVRRGNDVSVESWRCDFRARSKSGEWKWIRGVAKPRPLEGGSVMWDGISFDITDEVRLAREREALEERMRNLSANFPGYLWQREHCPDGTFRVHYLSDGVRRMLGYTQEEIEVLPRGLFDLFVAEDRESSLASIRAAEADLRTWRHDFRVRTKSGEVKWMRTFATPRRLDDGGVMWEGVTVDITDEVKLAEEHKALEARLRQTQKMESLGTLAGGAAHEFNNLLVPIMMLTEMVMADLEEGSPGYKNLQCVVDNAERASKIVKQILSFSRSDEAKHVAVDMASCVGDAVQLLRATLPATITFDEEIAAEDCIVLADETQMHQILMNLASNAKHAIDGKIGRIAIRLAVVELGDAVPASGQVTNLRPGRYARLTVEDTGCGMDRATMARIFEPFFTTKAVGKGTGLGLSVIHGIVTKHGGAIDVRSEVGKGTTLDVYLPLHDRAAPALPAADADGDGLARLALTG
jgi:PAS domain S-box-containing protein